MKIDNLDRTYKLCLSTGCIKEKIPDMELIKSLKQVAEKGLEFINNLSKNIASKSVAICINALRYSPCSISSLAILELYF